MESHSHNEEQTRGHTSTSDHQSHGYNHHPRPSQSELLASGKVLAEAAMHRGGKNMDKSELAGAAADLLYAASEYGKFQDKPLGKVVGQAENYLYKYHTSHSTTTTTTTTNPDHSTTTTTTTDETIHSTNHPGKVHGNSSDGTGGYGEYIKLAEGLFNKHSGGEHGHSGSDYGEYAKMAGDFLKKH